MTIHDITTNPVVNAQYQEWKSQPFTQTVIDLVRQEGRVRMPAPDFIKGDVALAMLGEASGWQNCLDRIEHLDQVLTKQPAELVADYGAILPAANKPK